MFNVPLDLISQQRNRARARVCVFQTKAKVCSHIPTVIRPSLFQQIHQGLAMTAQFSKCIGCRRASWVLTLLRQ